MKVHAKPTSKENCGRNAPSLVKLSLFATPRSLQGSLGGSVVKNHLSMQETQVPSLGREDHVEKDSNPLQYSCLGNPMIRGAWAGYSSWDYKESNITK